MQSFENQSSPVVLPDRFDCRSWCDWIVPPLGHTGRPELVKSDAADIDQHARETHRVISVSIPASGKVVSCQASAD